ncbi:MAG: hypothetical protein Q8P57_01875 [Candidatus Pacearchaeota archaeon]|nr:hypothetical protein [Candidatus Pacearchaeota archaeon]
MKINSFKNNIIDEVIDEIDSALKDIRGLSFHQKRLAFCLSDGICVLLENYLKKKGVLKPGSKINHQWLKKKKENVLKILSERLVTSVESLIILDNILDVAFKIENKRNELVYGSVVRDEDLQELINDYLAIKKEIEND